MNEIVRCVAIDDEPLALDVIQKFCQRMGQVELKTSTDPLEGLEMIRQFHPDIVFLDIEMEGTNGLDLAAQLPKECCFIFTTAYLRYALNGFDLDAVDYLHKPFAFSRFQTAFAKAMRRMGREAMKSTAQSIVVKQEYKSITIPLDDILYVEALESYCKIHRATEKSVLSRILLKNLCSMLPQELFLRIHRSFIVSKSKIKCFNKQEITLCNGKVLPVGRQYVEQLSMLNIS